MSDKSNIEWTDATWNPVTGCTKISAGCANCYAETFANRWKGIKGHHFEQGFDLRLFPDRLEIPLKWKRPRRIFVNSMSDLFHEDIPIEFIGKVFDIMRKAYWHTFQVLTKRSKAMIEFSNTYDWPDNVMAGVSVENQYFINRIEALRYTKARYKFLSIEPLLEDIEELNLEGIDWVIVGGESGPNSRPMKYEWVRNIRDKCIEQEIPFLFKQWGGVRKKEAGRLLDGREWNEFPRIKEAVLA